MVWLRSEAIWRAWESLYSRREDWFATVVIWVFWDVMVGRDVSVSRMSERHGGRGALHGGWRGVVWSVRRSVSDFRLMNVCVVRQRKKERKKALESHLFLVVFRFLVYSLDRLSISELASITFMTLDLTLGASV